MDDGKSPEVGQSCHSCRDLSKRPRQLTHGEWEGLCRKCRKQRRGLGSSGGCGRPHELSWALLWSINRKVAWWGGTKQKDQAVAPVANVTQSKLAQLAAQSADKSRDKLLRQEIVTIWKASHQRSGWTHVPKNHLTQVRNQTSFRLKRKEVWLVVANLLVSESFFLAASPRRSEHDVPVKFQQGKCYSLFYDFYLCMNRKALYP